MSTKDRRTTDICVFIPTLNGGGAERAMVTLANEFAMRGYAVDLVVVNADGPFRSHVQAEVKVVELGTTGVLTALPSLVKYLRRSRPQAVLSAMGHTNVVAIMGRALSRQSPRLVISERSTFSIAWEHARKRGSRLTAAAMPRLARLLYPRADAVVSVSYGVAEDLLKHVPVPAERSHIVYNPVVGPDFNTYADQPLDHPWFAAGAPPVIIGVGRLTTAKNFPLLINAFANVRSRRNCRLVILGEGEQRAALEVLAERLGIANDFLMPGFVDNPLPWMRQASLFVLSSSWEGLPAVLIQAMGCGTPVISTDCPSGPSEILMQGKWGKLVPVGDTASLSQAMHDALDHPSEFDVKIRASDFNLAQSVDAYLRVLGLTKFAGQD